MNSGAFVASSPRLLRRGAVGFSDWLDALSNRMTSCELTSSVIKTSDAERQSRITIPCYHGGVGRRCGVGRGLGDALGVAVGVGVTEGVGDGVGVDVGVGVGRGVGVGDGGLPSS